MRADRLVAILMLLQTRGQVTASEVAAELEISEKTARRDLEALGIAGLPVYSQAGRGGGWRLLGGGRTDLSGLSAPEVRALFLLAGPESTASPDVRAALRKLVRALPEPFREEAEAASNAVVVDPAGWGGRSVIRPQVDSPQYLGVVQEAVIRCRQLELGYVARDRAATTRTVSPLGLATKGHSWYLIAETAAGRRTFRVDRITSATVTDEPVVRPEGFDLAEVWRLISDEVQLRRLPARAIARIHPSMLDHCRWILGEGLRIGGPGIDGLVEVELRGPSLRALAGQIAGFGGGIVVTDPPELIAHLSEIARELSAMYG